MFKRILYTSFVDLSIPYGPGVNELVFIKDLLGRYQENLHVVIPRPARGMPVELVALDSTFLIEAYGDIPDHVLYEFWIIIGFFGHKFFIGAF